MTLSMLFHLMSEQIILSANSVQKKQTNKQKLNTGHLHIHSLGHQVGTHGRQVAIADDSATVCVSYSYVINSITKVIIPCLPLVLNGYNVIIMIMSPIFFTVLLHHLRSLPLLMDPDGGKTGIFFLFTIPKGK